MKDNPKSFWSSRDDVINRIVDDPKLAVFDFKRILGSSKAFKACQINHIPQRLTQSAVAHNLFKLCSDISKASGDFL